MSINLQSIIPLLKEFDVVTAGVFGSYARGEETPESDVDILVDFSKPVGLLNVVRLERTISEILKKPVDLVTRASLSPYLKNDVISGLNVFYEK
jgi:predicted nucleotidyltransferase